MGTIAQYEVSAYVPSIVGGTGKAIKYFFSRPVYTSWSDGKVITQPVSSKTPQELSIPFEKVNGKRFEVYASGYVSAASGSVAYVIKVNENILVSLSNEPGASDLPFHIRLVLEGNGLVHGTVQSLLAGIFEPERAIRPFMTESSLSLKIGVAFANSEEQNKAALTEFKVVIPD